MLRTLFKTKEHVVSRASGPPKARVQFSRCKTSSVVQVSSRRRGQDPSTPDIWSPRTCLTAAQGQIHLIASHSTYQLGPLSTGTFTQDGSRSQIPTESRGDGARGLGPGQQGVGLSLQ